MLPNFQFLNMSLQIPYETTKILWTSSKYVYVRWWLWAVGTQIRNSNRAHVRRALNRTKLKTVQDYRVKLRREQISREFVPGILRIFAGWRRWTDGLREGRRRTAAGQDLSAYDVTLPGILLPRIPAFVGPLPVRAARLLSEMIGEFRKAQRTSSDDWSYGVTNLYLFYVHNGN